MNKIFDIGIIDGGTAGAFATLRVAEKYSKTGDIFRKDSIYTIGHHVVN